MKRAERRQLKENELATGLSQFLKWVKKHEKKFMVIAIALAALLIIIVSVRLLVSYQKSREASYLSQVLTLRAELEQKPESLSQLERMAEKGRYGRIASLTLASYYLEKSDLEKAEKSLERVKNKGQDLIHYQILDLHAQVQIKKGNYDQAIEVYRRIEKENPRQYPMDVVLFRLAEAYEKKGENGQALNIYKDLQTKYQNTYYGYQAAFKVMKLEAGR